MPDAASTVQERTDAMSEPTLLTDEERQALRTALDDEYKAHETYAQVIRDFGEVRPFINIVEAEARHIAALVALFEKYGLAPPANRWAGNAPRFASVNDACRAGVQAEIDNAALYDRLFASTRRADLLGVFRALRAASQDNHLPALASLFRFAALGPTGLGIAAALALAAIGAARLFEARLPVAHRA